MDNYNSNWLLMKIIILSLYHTILKQKNMCRLQLTINTKIIHG